MAQLTLSKDIVNAALVEIGSSTLGTFPETTPSNDVAVAANQLYDTTLDEVLNKTYWEFAKKYLKLAKASPQPLVFTGDFSTAYLLPGDYLRPVRLANDAKYEIFSHFATITDEASTFSSVGITLTFSGAHGLVIDDYVVVDGGTQDNEIRRVVTVPDTTHVTVDAPYTADQAALTAWKSAKGERLYLLTDDESSATLEYVARVTDPLKWTPMFTQAIIKRLASKFALAIVHSRNLAESLLQEYAALVAEAETISGQSANRPRVMKSTILADVRRRSTVRSDKVLDNA